MAQAPNAVVKDIPECTVFQKKTVLKDFGQTCSFIRSAWDEYKAANPDLTILPYNYLGYLDEEFKEKDIHVVYAQQVERRGVETDTIKFVTAPAIHALCVTHNGPYEKIKGSFDAAFALVAERKLKINGMVRESYIHGPWDKKNPEEYVTEIQIPIEA